MTDLPVYDPFSKEQNGLEGFYNCPVEVEWNTKGYFETVDGNHRAVYLYCKMCNRIPVRMSAQDYKQWFNQKEAGRFVQYIERSDRKTFFAPVLHPLFMDYPYYGKTYLQSNLYAIFEFLGVHQPYSDIRFVDLGEDHGYFARCFWQLGLKKAVAVEEKRQLYDMDIALNRLLLGEDGDVRFCSDRYNFEGSFDIAYICDEFALKSPAEICRHFSRKLVPC